MIDLKNCQSEKLFPPNLKSAHHVAMCRAFDEQIIKLSEETRHLYILCNIKNLPDNMLDALADSYKITGYNTIFDIETKRQILLTAFIIAAKLGTAGAVEDLVTTIFGSATVEEWFEYGGEPYYFRISSDNSSMTEDEERLFMATLEKTKNVRSWLESIIISAKMSGNVYSGGVLAGIHEKTYIGTYGVEESNETISGNIYVAGKLSWQHEIEKFISSI